MNEAIEGAENDSEAPKTSDEPGTSTAATKEVSETQIDTPMDSIEVNFFQNFCHESCFYTSFNTNFTLKRSTWQLNKKKTRKMMRWKR